MVPDGISRALIHYQVIDLIDAGIEPIYLIVQPGEERQILVLDNSPHAKTGGIPQPLRCA